MYASQIWLDLLYAAALHCGHVMRKHLKLGGVFFIHVGILHNCDYVYPHRLWNH
jgi:hypothetical protein